MEKYIEHHGVLGMKWGVRKQRDPTPRSIAKADKKDMKWVKKQGAKITEKTQKSVSKEMQRFLQTELAGQMRLKSGKLSLNAVNQYNQKLASLMNEKVTNVTAPSGKAIKYIAKRGSIGVHTALADQGYNMDLVKRGVTASGRIAYKQEVLRKG